MSHPLSTEFIKGLVQELRNYLALCDEILSLTTRENQALAGQGSYQPLEFQKKRESLLPNIDLLLARLRNRRMVWQQAPLSDRERCEEVKPLFDNIQNKLMKVLLLDRENQQILLRRGLVPVSHLPATAAPKPNYVASVYQRNVTGSD